MSSAKSRSNSENDESDNDSEASGSCEVVGATGENWLNDLLNKMLILVKEFLIMAVVVATYAAFTNDSPKVGKSPAAYRFFNDPIITDWYKGEISDAINQARSSDIAFVMFYAPWDAESQRAREEFEKAAHLMKDVVTFLAVNCWQPGSECKTEYSKVYKWPVLIAYPTHGRGVQYNGPLIAVYMTRFLEKLTAPLTRNVNTFRLLGEHESVLVAKVDARLDSKEYDILYRAILRLLERDPLQEIAVSVVTQAKYDSNGSPNSPQFMLLTWNETLLYPSDEKWEVDALVDWVTKNVHQITAWIAPSGLKSSSLAAHLQNGPTLILFTPKNPLSVHNDIYSMLRETGQEYNNCEDHIWEELVKITIRAIRKEKYLKNLQLTEKCLEEKQQFRRITAGDIWTNSSFCSSQKFKNLRKLSFEHEPQVDSYEQIFKNLDDDDDGSKCPNTNIIKTSEINDATDRKSTRSLKSHAARKLCKSFVVAQNYEALLFSDELFDRDRTNVTGLRCKTNKTLSFIAMDSLYYHHYAEKLGIDLFKKRSKSAVVIVDDRMESHYIMRGVLNESNLRRFIWNYTRGALGRALKSQTGVVSKNTHSYPHDKRCGFGDGGFCVRELSAADFIDFVSQTNKAVIIFYYSKQCSFCNGISHRFLTVAKYFATLEEFEFARIDGDLNLLPWEYTMEIYPTVLFVPPNKVAESRVFPMDKPVTVPNLIGFILANLQPSMKLEAMWTLCQETKFYTNETVCISSLRRQISVVIDKALQEWRLNTDKAVPSMKIEHFHSLQTIFMQLSQNDSVVQEHFDSLKLLELVPLETVVR